VARNRFRAPARASLDAHVFAHPVFAGCARHRALLSGPNWPTISHLDELLSREAGVRFIQQDDALLGDGEHYETRIHALGTVATRAENWHDLFNALIWAMHAPIKRALNARQVAEVARHGPRQRSRAQCALTHFDEAGAVVWAAQPDLLAAWDAHDWPAFFGQRAAFAGGALRVRIFGHALLEHALVPERLPTAKCLVLCGGDPENWQERLAAAISAGVALADPQELRPLPLAGIPGWADGQQAPGFFDGDCFRPLRDGRRYPAPLDGASGA
jgi:hypothetical protein